MSSAPCPDCFMGSEHLGTPTGSTAVIHGLPTYVAEPENGATPKGIIIFITDAFGWDFVNCRLLCDKYAKKGGFLVYCPDFMLGKAMSPSVIPLMESITKPAPWFTTLFYKPLYVLKAIYYAIPFLVGTRAGVCYPRIRSFISSLRTSEPPFPTNNLKIGAAGFCWGGQHVFTLCSDAPSSRVHRHSSQTLSSTLEPLIDCGFTAHPSFVSIPIDAEKVSIPLSVSIGNEDMQMKGPKILELKELLEVKKKGDHEVVIIPGAKHGFAVRVDAKDAFQAECADKAEEQAVSWFSRWFS